MTQRQHVFVLKGPCYISDAKPLFEVTNEAGARTPSSSFHL